MSLFTEFRKDGWPLCPRCGEDELWSSVAISATRSVTLAECWGGDFTCYYCNWQTNGKRHTPQGETPELLIMVSEVPLAERVKRVDALFWDKFRQAYPDHPWLKLKEQSK